MGLFDTILGPSFLGLSGSSSETEQKLDPTTQALNAFRLSQLRSGNTMTGGLGALLSNLQASGAISQDTAQQLQNAVAVANTPGMNYDQWYGNAYGGLQPGTQTQQLLDYYGGTNQNVLNQQQQALANQGNTLAAGLGYSNDLYSMLGQQARGDIGQQQQALGGLYDSINQALQQGTAGQRDYLGNYYQDAGNNLNQMQGRTQDYLNNYYQGAANNINQMQNNTFDVLNKSYSGAQNQLGQMLGQGSDYLSNYYSQVDKNIDQNLSPQMFDAGSKYYQMIMGPQIGNDYSLMGLGRSGARTQAENIAGASVGSQIAQKVADLKQQGYMQQGQEQYGLRGQINQLQGNLLGQQTDQYGKLLGHYSDLQSGLLSQQGQEQSDTANLFNQMQGANYSQQGQEQYGLSNQLLGNEANLYGQQGSQYADLYKQLNSILSQYGLGQTSQAGSLFNNYMGNVSNINQSYSNMYNQNQQQAGQGMQNLNTQYLDNLYGLNQAAPGVFTNLRSADLARAGKAVDYSDYGRQVASGTAGNMLNSYLSAVNSTPYTPAGTTSKTGNEGLLNTAFGAGMGQAAGAAVAGSDINIKENLEEFNSKEFLDKLKAYTYNYVKDFTNYPNLKQVGIIAQDLENTELGKDYVITSDRNIKYIDYSRMLSLMMACIVSLNSRISELEDNNKVKE